VNGKIVGGGLLVIGAVAGIALYYLEVYAYYQPVAFVPGAEILLTTLQSQTPEAIVVDDLQGTEKTSSPLGLLRPSRPSRRLGSTALMPPRSVRRWNAARRWRFCPSQTLPRRSTGSSRSLAMAAPMPGIRSKKAPPKG
jgi:hypothetical protein